MSTILTTTAVLLAIITVGLFVAPTLILGWLPVVLLIVGHLFFATGLSPRAKLGWISAASATVALHIATPWLVRYGSTRLAFLHALSGAAMTLTMGVLTIYPVVAMWRAAPARVNPTE